jgi:6-phosphogluconolactonase (cycloisomerase 2 family)
VGKLKLVQTIVGSTQTDASITYDPDVSSTRDFVLSPDDQELYITSWQGNLLTFDRSATDGTLARVSTQPLFNGFGVAITPDGKHLYAAGANTPNQVQTYDIDPATGEPTPIAMLGSSGLELAVAGAGAVLFQSNGGVAGSSIVAYLIDPATGELGSGVETPLDSPVSSFVFLVDDAHQTLYAESAGAGNALAIHRYTVDDATGALMAEGQVVTDLQWAYALLAMCPGTTRVYVPEDAGSIGYLDVSGTDLTLPSSFTHPDLAHVWSVTVSPDCKNLYAVTHDAASASIVVLARDDAGDLTWLETLPVGPGTPRSAITEPWYARTSADGKNVYVNSWAPREGLLVFQRDTTGTASF